MIAGGRASPVILLSLLFHLVQVEASLRPFCYLSPGLGSGDCWDPHPNLLASRALRKNLALLQDHSLPFHTHSGTPSVMKGPEEYSLQTILSNIRLGIVNMEVCGNH